MQDQPTNPTRNNTQPPVQVPVKERLMKPIGNLKKKVNPRMFAIGLFVVLAGVGSGWLLAGRPAGGSGSDAPEAGKVNGGVGISDEDTFSDSAEGILKEGGIDGEGTHHLVREGGESKNVYLTSTVIDLESFTGKQVQVWGQTTTARKAGWLMDVGKVKVIE